MSELIDINKARRIHFVGIGGAGMSSIAEILIESGYQVSGSDLQLTAVTERLRDSGAMLFAGHHSENLPDVDLLVYSSAVSMANPELLAAKSRNIPCLRRAEMLGLMMAEKRGIAIAGTHGKTTTSALVGAVLQAAGLNPTMVVGGQLHRPENIPSEKGEWLVAEADEYDRSMLALQPEIAVINNVEAEHFDCYRDEPDLIDTFLAFAGAAKETIVCLDDENLQRMMPDFDTPPFTYGLNKGAALRAKTLENTAAGSRFKVYLYEAELGEVALPLHGDHNIQNALAAVAVGLKVGGTFQQISEGLRAFQGVGRRFEIKAELNGIMIVDDYAHHPTEVQATLAGVNASWPEKRIVVIFQPHLYSRTEQFFTEFAQAFLNADVLIVSDVYPAREAPIPGVSGRMISEAAKMLGMKSVQYVADMKEIPAVILPQLQSGDMLITMGAGDIWKTGEKIIDELLQNSGNGHEKKH